MPKIKLYIPTKSSFIIPPPPAKQNKEQSKPIQIKPTEKPLIPNTTIGAPSPNAQVPSYEIERSKAMEDFFKSKQRTQGYEQARKGQLKPTTPNDFVPKYEIERGKAIEDFFKSKQRLNAYEKMRKAGTAPKPEVPNTTIGAPFEEEPKQTILKAANPYAGVLRAPNLLEKIHLEIPEINSAFKLGLASVVGVNEKNFKSVFPDDPEPSNTIEGKVAEAAGTIIANAVAFKALSPLIGAPIADKLWKASEGLNLLNRTLARFLINGTAEAATWGIIGGSQEFFRQLLDNEHSLAKIGVEALDTATFGYVSALAGASPSLIKRLASSTLGFGVQTMISLLIRNGKITKDDIPKIATNMGIGFVTTLMDGVKVSKYLDDLDRGEYGLQETINKIQEVYPEMSKDEAKEVAETINKAYLFHAVNPENEELANVYNALKATYLMRRDIDYVVQMDSSFKEAAEKEPPDEVLVRILSRTTKNGLAYLNMIKGYDAEGLPFAVPTETPAKEIVLTQEDQMKIIKDYVDKGGVLPIHLPKEAADKFKSEIEKFGVKVPEDAIKTPEKPVSETLEETIKAVKPPKTKKQSPFKINEIPANKETQFKIGDLVEEIDHQNNVVRKGEIEKAFEVNGKTFYRLKGSKDLIAENLLRKAEKPVETPKVEAPEIKPVETPQTMPKTKKQPKVQPTTETQPLQRVAENTKDILAQHNLQKWQPVRNTNGGEEGIIVGSTDYGVTISVPKYGEFTIDPRWIEPIKTPNTTILKQLAKVMPDNTPYTVYEANVSKFFNLQEANKIVKKEGYKDLMDFYYKFLDYKQQVPKIIEEALIKETNKDRELPKTPEEALTYAAPIPEEIKDLASEYGITINKEEYTKRVLENNPELAKIFTSDAYKRLRSLLSTQHEYWEKHGFGSTNTWARKAEALEPEIEKEKQRLQEVINEQIKAKEQRMGINKPTEKVQPPAETQSPQRVAVNIPDQDVIKTIKDIDIAKHYGNSVPTWDVVPELMKRFNIGEEQAKQILLDLDDKELIHLQRYDNPSALPEEQRRYLIPWNDSNFGFVTIRGELSNEPQPQISKQNERITDKEVIRQQIEQDLKNKVIKKNMSQTALAKYFMDKGFAVGVAQNVWDEMTITPEKIKKEIAELEKKLEQSHLKEVHGKRQVIRKDINETNWARRIDALKQQLAQLEARQKEQQEPLQRVAETPSEEQKPQPKITYQEIAKLRGYKTASHTKPENFLNLEKLNRFQLEIKLSDLMYTFYLLNQKGLIDPELNALNELLDTGIYHEVDDNVLLDTTKTLVNEYFKLVGYNPPYPDAPSPKDTLERLKQIEQQIEAEKRKPTQTEQVQPITETPKEETPKTETPTTQAPQQEVKAEQPKQELIEKQQELLNKLKGKANALNMVLDRMSNDLQILYSGDEENAYWVKQKYNLKKNTDKAIEQLENLIKNKEQELEQTKAQISQIQSQIGKPTGETEQKGSFEDLLDKAYKDKSQELSEKRGSITITTPDFTATKEFFRDLLGGLKTIIEETQDMYKHLQFYPDLAMHTRNDIRLLYGRLNEIAGDKTERLYLSVYGGLNKNEAKLTGELITELSELGRKKTGRGNPTRTLEQQQQIVNDLIKQADDKVIKAVKTFRELRDALTQEQIQRGLLEPDELLENYSRVYVAEYTPYLYKGIPRLLKNPARHYLDKAKGTAKKARTDPEAIIHQFVEVMVDNEIQDFITNLATEYDILPKLNEQQRAKIFGVDENGRIKDVVPDKVYEIDGKKYYGYTPARFKRTVFKTEEGYYAFGRYHKTYLVPEEIYQTFTHFTDRGNKFLYIMNTAVRYWKSMAILSSYPKFNINNLIGDMYFMLLQSPEPEAVIREFDTALRFLAGAKDPYLEKLTKFINDNDVIGSTYLLTETHKGNNPIAQFLSLATKSSQLRESFLRVAYASYLYRRYEAGLAEQTIAKHDWIYLDDLKNDPYHALGKIARDIEFDYSWASKTYDRLIRGGAFPLGTWYFKASWQFWRFFARHPFKTLGFVIGIPLAAEIYNHRFHKDLEVQLPDSVRDRTHIILGQNPDGTIRVWMPQLPPDVLIGSKVFSIAVGEAFKYLNGEEDLKQAAINTLKQWGIREARGIEFLLNPIVRYLTGLANDRDPYDGASIYPVNKEDLTPMQLNYYRGIFLLKVLVPYLSEYAGEELLGKPSDLVAKKILDGLIGKGIIGVYDIDPKQAIRIGNTMITWDDYKLMKQVAGQEIYYLTLMKDDWINSGKTVQEYIQTPNFARYMNNIKQLWINEVKDSDIWKQKPNRDDVLQKLNALSPNEVALILEQSSRLTDLFNSYYKDWLDTQRQRLIANGIKDDRLNEIMKQLEQARAKKLYDTIKSLSKTSRAFGGMP